ncbi:MAG: zf-HC2 domain-containing protein [Longimicrobiales bacterium]|nr:zf-HC2 domain-containing protein [Longimicrobiales bacterium]
MTCHEIREQLPEFVSGGLPVEGRRGIGAHIEACPACAEEARTLRLLRSTRPQAPVGLEARIRSAVHADLAASPPGVLRLEPRRSAPRVPRWMIATAALLALAVGTPLIVDSMRETTSIDGTELARVEDGLVTSSWARDDGLVAGAPALDELSDEALLALLAQMEAGA